MRRSKRSSAYLHCELGVLAAYGRGSIVRGAHLTLEDGVVLQQDGVDVQIEISCVRVCNDGD